MSLKCCCYFNTHSLIILPKTSDLTYYLIFCIYDIIYGTFSILYNCTNCTNAYRTQKNGIQAYYSIFIFNINLFSKSQKQGLLLLSALTRSESSIKVMLDKKIVPVILSAMCNTNCK